MLRVLMSSKSSADFSALPPEYQNLLRLAKEKHHLDVVPLQALSGGQTGAFLYLVSVSAGDLTRVGHLVVKFDRVNERGKQSEVERHHLALGQAPPTFAGRRMAQLAYEIEHEGAVALFYSVAGQSLQRFRTLASQENQSRLETLFAATNDYLVGEWNSGAVFQQALHPRELLERWLGYRLKPDGHVGSLLRERFLLDPDTEGFLIQGQVFPNPLSYGLDAGRWRETRPIDVLIGFQHGDLNIGNILAEFAEDSEALGGYFLIDFALYKSGMPLLYDQRYLEMSYLIRELDRASFNKWVSLVNNYSTRDIPNPKDVPVELAGACAAINGGRQAFERWVRECHPSLSDDLWGQFWLAAVAAGLNFCNKKVLSTEARLAGLIYSAIHLKRYCTQFGVPLPVDVRLLYDPSRWGTSKSPDKPVSPSQSQRRNLPTQPTPFIGRQAELKAVRDLLVGESVRLLALTGPGGTGKTRLALQAAAEEIAHFENGACFVDLAPVLEADAVIPAIARTVGLRDTSDRPLLDELKAQLRSQEMLLLLDNFEQVSAAAPSLGELLQDCPRLKLLVTSREPLHVRGEQVFPVPPLALPNADLKKPSVDQLTRCDAVQLFVERAQAVKHDFKLTDENAQAVTEICVRLDGLPLAIELATARLSLLSPQALLERVKSRLKLLRGGARDLPVRQQTLRGTIDWSHELLDTGEQRLFALLSVFSACTFAAVEAVAGGIKTLDETGVDVLDGVASLVDKSLIRQADQGSGEPRLVMLETIREYATERLEQNRDLSAAAHAGHAIYFADFTRRQWERLIGPERGAAVGELETEIENLRTAWRYWVAEGDFEQLRKLADCLWLLYDARGWYHATVDLTTDLLKVLGSTPSTPERAEQEIMLQISLARALLAVKGYTPEVEQVYTRALELCQRQGEVPQLFPVLRGLSTYYVYRTEFDKAARVGEQILSLGERLDDANMRVDGHLVVGYCLAFQTSPAKGLEHLEQGIANYDPAKRRSHSFRLGNDPGVTCFTTSALVSWMLGFPERALKRANEAVALADRLNHPFSMAYALFHTGLLHLWRGEAELAQGRAQPLLAIAEEHEFRIWTAVGSCLHGAALAGLGRAEEGLRQIRRGMDLYQALKTRPPVFWPLLLFIQAGACGLAGRPEEGLALLDEAMDLTAQNYGAGLSSDLCRSKGELLLAVSPENAAEAEPWFRQALEMAQQGEAKMLELRAATSLCRVWQGRGQTEQGRRLLGDAYAKMTEGFATVDLQAARALLAE
jgi:predicted ATPase